MRWAFHLQVVLRHTVDSGLIALAITYSLALSGLLQWSIRLGAQAETFFTSGIFIVAGTLNNIGYQLIICLSLLSVVERLHHYADLECEGQRENPDYLPPKDWPEKGAVSVKDLKVRYRHDLPVILKGISFEIPSGSMVSKKSYCIHPFDRLFDSDG